MFIDICSLWHLSPSAFFPILIRCAEKFQSVSNVAAKANKSSDSRCSTSQVSIARGQRFCKHLQHLIKLQPCLVRNSIGLSHDGYPQEQKAGVGEFALGHDLK